jgi:hypothetical protein
MALDEDAPYGHLTMTDHRSITPPPALRRPWPGPLKLAAAALTAASLSACVVVPAERGYQAGPVVTAPPPPPQSEYYGQPPAAGYVWISGFWAWQLGRHVWIGGHWDAPHPGYRWVPHAWYPEGRGWRLHEGHWDR